MTKKNIALLTILLVLISIAIFLSKQDRLVQKSAAKEDLIAVKGGEIDRIEIRRSDGVVSILEASQRGWQLNDSLKGDENILRVIETALREIRILREVPPSQSGKIQDLMSSKKIDLLVESRGRQLSYALVGEESKKRAYVQVDDDLYLVHIPGYTTYLPSILGLHTRDLKDRTLFESNYRSIRELGMDFKQEQEKSWSIWYGSEGLGVREVDDLDTVAMMDYIEQYQNFYLDAYFESGMNPDYDSLMEGEAWIEIHLNDINAARSRHISIYKGQDENRFLLARDQKGQQFLIEKNRFRPLMVNRDHFKAKRNQE